MIASAKYFLPFLILGGLPLACSGSTSKTAPNDSDSTAGGAESDPSGSAGARQSEAGSKSTSNPLPEGGASNPSRGVGGESAGLGGAPAVAGASATEEGGSPGAAGENAGGQGGSDGTIPEQPIDPNSDGAGDAASGRYRLYHVASKQCLVSDTGVSSATCSAAANQGFFIDDAGGSFVRVRSVASGSCVGAVKGVVKPVVCAASSQLELVPQTGGSFQLVLPNQQCLSLTAGEPSVTTCTDAALWTLNPLGENFALGASYSATSTFPGYSVDYIHDADLNAGLSGHSWVNNWNPPSLTFPQEVNVTFPAARQISLINLYTSAGYEIGSYDIDYWNGQAWTNLEVVKGNQLKLVVHAFPTIVTSKLRIVVRRGPETQFNFARINELQVY